MKRREQIDPSLLHRTRQEQITQTYQRFCERKFFIKAFNAFPDIVLVLDSNRQIIYANEYLLAYLGIQDVNTVLGKRVGEAFNCIHAEECPGGCGTTEACQECSAFQAIINTQHGIEDHRQIRLTVKTENGQRVLEFQVRAAPLHIDPDVFTIFTIKGLPLKPLVKFAAN